MLEPAHRTFSTHDPWPSTPIRSLPLRSRGKHNAGTYSTSAAPSAAAYPFWELAVTSVLWSAFSDRSNSPPHRKLGVLEPVSRTANPLFGRRHPVFQNLVGCGQRRSAHRVSPYFGTLYL